MVVLTLLLASMADGNGGFERIVQPFIASHCYACHNGRSAAGGLNLQTLNRASSLSESRDEWVKIVSRISSGNMPPKSEARPDASETDAVIVWLKEAISSGK